jgi:hypothetical protein
MLLLYSKGQFPQHGHGSKDLASGFGGFSMALPSEKPENGHLLLHTTIQQKFTSLPGIRTGTPYSWPSMRIKKNSSV